MSTIQAKIAAKKLTETTGVEDKVAEQMFHRGEGGHYLAIIDLAFLERTEGRDEKHVVRLEISQLEVMPDGATADHARELMRSVYLKRQPEGFEGTDGDSTNDIIRRGKNTVLTNDNEDAVPHDMAASDPPKRRTKKTLEQAAANLLPTP